MRVLIDMGHPAHVHLFKNTIWKLKSMGHQVKVTARDKDVTLKLLNELEIEHEVRGVLKPSLISKATDMVRVNIKMMKIARDFKPDLMLGVHNPYIAQVSRVLGIPSIIFTDSEPVPIADFLTFPFTKVIVTTTTYRKELGKKQMKVNSFKELSYLHPSHFTPDSTVLEKLGLKPGERFAVLRLISWEASHDVDEGGFSLEDKQRLIDSLKDKVKIFISSERELPESMKKYQLKLPANKFHDLLNYASILITDGQTVTTEAACLGVPAVRCNSFVGEDDMGNFIELENKYDLIYSVKEPEKAIEISLELLDRPGIKEEWRVKKEKMLADKLDLSDFFTNLISGWPESLEAMKNNDNLT